MADVSAKGVNPLFLKIAAYLNGLCDIDSVLRVAWPRAVFEPFQKDIIGAILGGLNGKYREVAIKGCTGAGKGAAVAAAANLWFEASDQAKVVVNSQSRQHAVDVMFAEIVRWRRAMRVRCEDEILETKIKCHEQKHITVTNPDRGEGFSGMHGGAILFVYDESTGTAASFWELGKTQADMAVALGNPRTRGGFFKSLFPLVNPDVCQDVATEGGAMRRVITIGGMDCTNVKTKTRTIPNQLTWEAYSEIKAHPDPNHGRVYADGCFPTEDAELQLILPSWLPRHIAASKTVKPIVECFGLDIADSATGDSTVLACGSKAGVAHMLTRRKAGTMKNVGWILATIKNRFNIDLATGQQPIVVDADGIGKGVSDRLEELGCWVIAHRGSEAPDDRRAHYNRRTETHSRLAARLNPDGPFGVDAWAIPNDVQLIEELCAPDKIFDSDGERFRITPKSRPGGATPIRDHRGHILQSIKEKLGRSPDKADAVAMLYAAVYLLHHSGAESQVVRPGELLIAEMADMVPPTPAEVDGFDAYFKDLLLEADAEIDDDNDRRRMGLPRKLPPKPKVK